MCGIVDRSMCRVDSGRGGRLIVFLSVFVEGDRVLGVSV